MNLQLESPWFRFPAEVRTEIKELSLTANDPIIDPFPPYIDPADELISNYLDDVRKHMRVRSVEIFA